MAYHVKVKDDVKAVKDCVKDVPFDGWAEKLRSTFNNDTIIRIRVEKGIFKEGDNAYIDKVIFKKDTTVNGVKGYPIDATYGKLLKKGPGQTLQVKNGYWYLGNKILEKGVLTIGAAEGGMSKGTQAQEV